MPQPEQPQASTSRSRDDQSYEEDRAKYYQQIADASLDEVFGASKAGGRAESRQEAYNRCAPDVVGLLKCVEAHPGPSWYWSCGEEYLTLQKCYVNQQKRNGVGKLLQSLQHTVRQTQEWAAGLPQQLGLGGSGRQHGSNGGSSTGVADP